jgi:hypothetical protein
LDHPGIAANTPIGPLAHLGLGRALAAGSQPAKARSAYQDFFRIWKEADPNISILEEAQREYAKLQ